MVNINITNDIQQAYIRLKSIVAKKDVIDWWEKSGVHIAHHHFLDSVKENIRTQGRLSGQSWNYQTEDKYKAYKQSILGDLTVLRWKGGDEILYPSLVNPRDKNHIFKQSGLNLTVGTKVGYAGRLARGGTNMFDERFPGRDFFPTQRKPTNELFNELNQSFRTFTNRK